MNTSYSSPFPQKNRRLETEETGNRRQKHREQAPHPKAAPKIHWLLQPVMFREKNRKPETGEAADDLEGPRFQHPTKGGPRFHHPTEAKAGT